MAKTANAWAGKFCEEVALQRLKTCYNDCSSLTIRGRNGIDWIDLSKICKSRLIEISLNVDQKP